MCNYVESKGVLHSVFSLPEIGCPWIGVHLKVRKSSLCFFCCRLAFAASGFFFGCMMNNWTPLGRFLHSWEGDGAPPSYASPCGESFSDWFLKRGEIKDQIRKHVCNKADHEKYSVGVKNVLIPMISKVLTWSSGPASALPVQALPHILPRWGINKRVRLGWNLFLYLGKC